VVKTGPGQNQEILPEIYRAERVAQVVEHLPKCEALNSNSSTVKKKKKVLC
jgi:hypothetical protein